MTAVPSKLMWHCSLLAWTVPCALFKDLRVVQHRVAA